MKRKYEIEKLDLEVKTILKMLNTLEYLIPIFERDLEKAEHLLDQNLNQKK